MGQYGNQPDFATTVGTVSAFPTTGINSAAIYIGALTDESQGGTITVRPVGNSSDVTFSGITSGSFIPVIVTSITSATNIPAASVLLVY
jgi:hypothetical protein